MLRSLLPGILALLLAFTAHGDELPDNAFSRQIRALTDDWVAQDWRKSILKAHPDRYTWQSDHHLSFYPEEPAAGRTAEQVARFHFDGFSLEDDTTDPTLISMNGAEEITPGILVKTYHWSFAFDENVSLFGVVTTPSGTYVPFHANCLQDDDNFSVEYDYRFEECVKKVVTVLAAVRGVEATRLTLPAPVAPLTMPGRDSQYLPSGVSVGVRGDYSGMRRVTVMVSPPRVIPDARLRAEIEAFSSALVDGDNDRTDINPGTSRWVGSVSDPWIRRGFPEAFDGPSTIMAGAVKTPDGKVSLIGVRCPNDGWKAICAHGVELARQQAASGTLEQRRRAVVAATWKPLPANGLKASDVVGIYTHGRNTMGYGGYMTGYVVDGPLLLKDGTACTCFDGPLGAIIPRESRAADPGDWGQWRKSGDRILVTFDGETEEIAITGDNLMIGGNARTRVEGTFRLVSGGGMIGSNSGWLSESYVIFRSDGTFSDETITGFSFSDGNLADPGVSVVGGSSGGGAFGRYEIDGYNLKLTYPDGRVAYRGFAQYAHEAGSARKDAVMIDGWVYFRHEN